MSKLTTFITRGKTLESLHEVKCFISSLDGKKIFSTNNEKDVIYPRSSIKIFKAYLSLNQMQLSFTTLIKNKLLYLVRLIVVKTFTLEN